MCDVSEDHRLKRKDYWWNFSALFVSLLILSSVIWRNISYLEFLNVSTGNDATYRSIVVSANKLATIISSPPPPPVPDFQKTNWR